MFEEECPIPGRFQNPGGSGFGTPPLSENTLEIPIGQKVTGSGQREFMGLLLGMVSFIPLLIK